MIMQATGHKIKIKLKAGLQQWVNTIDVLATITKRCILYTESCFVHVIFIANQATLDKNPVTIESVAFSFLVNCIFNNTFSL